MNPERLHDAITLLPEELLTPVDQLRQKKQFPWKSMAAVAACAVLAVGLWLINPGQKVSMDAINGAAAEVGKPKEEVQYSSGTGADSYQVEVLEVAEDHILIVEPPADGGCIQMATLTMTFENLDQVPTLQPGQTIRIYFESEQFDKNEMVIKPYKIEIIEEDTQ